MVIINQSVGEKGVNSPFDVEKVQKLINDNLHLLPKTKKLTLDKKAGKSTNTAIYSYQSDVMKMAKPDGLVSPNGQTLKSLQKTARTPRPANVVVFINKILPVAKNIKVKYRVPVSVVIAQSALETGWGKAVKGNAYFGVKSHNTKGATTSFKTTEVVNGKKVSLVDSFRSYKNINEAADDYGKFITTNIRYKPAFSYVNDPYKFAEKIGAAGYATDPQYANKLKYIISTFYLDEHDK